MKAKPDDSDALVYKAEIDIRAGKANDAVPTLQAVLKNDPENNIAHYQLAWPTTRLGTQPKPRGNGERR